MFTADCNKGTLEAGRAPYLDEDGKLIHASTLNGKPERTNKGIFAEAQWNIVCGKPQKLREPVPLKGDGNLVVYYYVSEVRGNRD